MHNEKHKMLERIAFGSFATGVLLAILGIYLVYLGETGDTTIKLMKQELKTTSVGIASIFIAAVLIVFNLRRILASFDKTIETAAGKMAVGELRIIDVRVTQHKHEKNCSIDFWVSNDGGSQVVVTGVELEVVDTARAELVKGPMVASGRYDLDIADLEKIKQTALCPVSQEIEPGKSDRFSVVLQAEGLGSGVFAAWLLRPKLITNFGTIESVVVEIWLPFKELGSFQEIKQTEEMMKKYQNAH